MSFFKIYKLSEFLSITDDDIKYFDIHELLDIYFAYIYDDSTDTDDKKKIKNLSDIDNKNKKISKQIIEITSKKYPKENTPAYTYLKKLFVSFNKESLTHPITVESTTDNEKLSLSNAQYLHHLDSIYKKYMKLQKIDKDQIYSNINELKNENLFFKMKIDVASRQDNSKNNVQQQGVGVGVGVGVDVDVDVDVDVGVGVFEIQKENIDNYIDTDKLNNHSIEDLLNIYYAYSPKKYVNKLLIKKIICDWLKEKDILNRAYFHVEFVYQLLIGNTFDTRKFGFLNLVNQEQSQISKLLITYPRLMQRIIKEFNILCNCVYNESNIQKLNINIINKLKSITIKEGSNTNIELLKRIIYSYDTSNKSKTDTDINMYIISYFTIENGTVTENENENENENTCFYADNIPNLISTIPASNETTETVFIMVNKGITNDYERVQITETIHPKDTALQYCNKSEYTTFINNILTSNP